MIFVTVGTHEQPFNRLIEEIDRLIANNIIKDEVFMQIGFSTYVPKHCKYAKLLSYGEMQKYYKSADVIITHGGPASFIEAVANGKIPIVVPREKRFCEHVNDHQLIFCRELSRRQFSIYLLEDVTKICEAIDFVKNNSSKNMFISNNANFKMLLSNEIDKLIGDDA